MDRDCAARARVFCAGADIKERRAMQHRCRSAHAEVALDRGALDRTEKPVIRRHSWLFAWAGAWNWPWLAICVSRPRTPCLPFPETGLGLSPEVEGTPALWSVAAARGVLWTCSTGGRADARRALTRLITRMADSADFAARGGHRSGRTHCPEAAHGNVMLAKQAVRAAWLP